MASERASQQAFFVVSARLFAASAALTTLWCASMSAMGELPMPGGWTMSMAWNADTRTDVAGGRGMRRRYGLRLPSRASASAVLMSGIAARQET